jgi:hypothetical protein
VTWIWAQDTAHLPDWLRYVFPNTLYTTKDLCLPAVDLVLYFGNGEVLWECWARAAMGLKSSPYQAVQAVLVAKDYVLGDHQDSNNDFRWDKVRLNLPGSVGYDPSLP